MDLKEYQDIAKKTSKKFDSEVEEISTWGLGITGEAGDVASCIKKTYQHDNDKKDGIRENLGDMFWYAAMICNFFNWDMSEVLKENIDKLEGRYVEGKFTLDHARREGEMVDWNEEK